MNSRARSFASALTISALLSAPLIVVPIFGPVAATWLGGRRAASRGVVAGYVLALVWGIGIWLLSGQTIGIGGTEITLGPLSLLIPVICGGLVAGGMFALGGRIAVQTGLVFLVAGCLWTGYQLQPVVALVQQLRPAPAIGQADNGSCPGRLKQLYNAAMLYSDSWDGMLPPADRWQDALAETLPDRSLAHCPELGAEGHGYAMNDALSSQKAAELSDASSVPLFYDTSLAGPNAHDAYESLPSPGRHGGANNVVFADGSASSVRSP